MNEDINDDGTLLTNDVNDIDSFSSIKVKILLSIKNIREKKKCPDSNAIFEDLLKKDSTITEKSLLDNVLSKFIDLKLVINKKTPNGLDSLFLTNYIQTDPITNISESSDVRTEQNGNELFNTSKATQNAPLLPIDIEIPHSHNLINKCDPLQSILKFEAQISALKSYVKCEISGLNNKMDSLYERLNQLMHNETSHSKAFELLKKV